jgi:hypothetical protein
MLDNPGVCCEMRASTPYANSKRFGLTDLIHLTAPVAVPVMLVNRALATAVGRIRRVVGDSLTITIANAGFTLLLVNCFQLGLQSRVIVEVNCNFFDVHTLGEMTRKACDYFNHLASKSWLL